MGAGFTGGLRVAEGRESRAAGRAAALGFADLADDPFFAGFGRAEDFDADRDGAGFLAGARFAAGRAVFLMTFFAERRCDFAK